MFTLPADFAKLASASGVKPRYMFRVRLPERAMVRVVDWTLISAGWGVRVRIDSVDYDFVEGTDFVAATSNIVTAENIRAAIDQKRLDATDPHSHIVKARRIGRGGVDVTGFGTVGGGTYGDRIKISAPASASTFQVSIIGGTFAIELTDYEGADIDIASGDRAIIESSHAPALIVGDVAELGQQVDAVSREYSATSTSFEVLDNSCRVGDFAPENVAQWDDPLSNRRLLKGYGYPGTIRRIATDNVLLRKRCEVYLGFDGLESPSTNWLKLPDVFLQEGKSDYGVINIDSSDAFEMLDKVTFSGTFINRHPLQCLQLVLEACGFGSDLGTDNPFDLDTLDPDDDTTKSHWVVTRANFALYAGLEAISAIAGTASPLSRSWPSAEAAAGPGVENGMVSQESARDVVNSIVRIMNGLLRPRGSDGRFEFVPHQINASAVRTLDAIDDLAEIEVVEQFANIANTVTIEHAETPDSNVASRFTSSALQSSAVPDKFTVFGTESISEIGEHYELTIDSAWLNVLAIQGLWGPCRDDTEATGDGGHAFNESLCFYYDALGATSGVTDTHLVVANTVHGYCGGRLTYNAGTSAWDLETAEAGLTVGGATERRTYLKILSNDRSRQDAGIDYFETDQSQAEIIALSAVDGWGRESVSRQAGDDISGSQAHRVDTRTGVREVTRSEVVYRDVLSMLTPAEPDYRELPRRLEFEVDATYNDDGFTTGRGGLGSTTPEKWNRAITASSVDQVLLRSHVIDVTIGLALAREHLRRWMFGATVLRVRASLRHVDLELGDLVRISRDDQMLAVLAPFTDSNTVFEITRKEIRALDDSPGVEFELTYFRRDDFFVELFNSPTLGGAVFIAPEIGIVVTPVDPETIVDNDGTPVYVDLDGDASYETGVTRL